MCVYIQDIFAMNLPVSLARFYVLLLIYLWDCDSDHNAVRGFTAEVRQVTLMIRSVCQGRGLCLMSDTFIQCTEIKTVGLCRFTCKQP